MVAFKKLARRLKEEGFFDELRAREYFMKDCIKGKDAKARAVARERKRQHRQQENWGPIPTSTKRQKKSNKGKRGKRERFLVELTKNALLRKKNAKKGKGNRRG
jgi:ribosomal protein S21